MRRRIIIKQGTENAEQKSFIAPQLELGKTIREFFYSTIRGALW